MDTALLSEISGCTVCAPYLPLGPRPVVQFSATSRVLIIGQAPGTKVHASGIPWQDDSGDHLREWTWPRSGRILRSRESGLGAYGFLLPGKSGGRRRTTAARMRTAMARPHSRAAPDGSPDASRRILRPAILPSQGPPGRPFSTGSAASTASLPPSSQRHIHRGEVSAGGNAIPGSTRNYSPRSAPRSGASLIAPEEVRHFFAKVLKWRTKFSTSAGIRRPIARVE